MEYVEVNCPHCGRVQKCDISERKSPSINGPILKQEMKIRELGFICSQCQGTFHFKVESYG